MIKLYVGNLPYSTNDSSLKDMFAAYGNVVSSTIIMDKNSGRSKGFGFVEIEDDASGQSAIAEMNGKEIEGRKIIVSVARPMTERPERRDFRR